MCPSPPRALLVAWSCGLALGACSESVLLGGECPDSQRACLERPPDGAADAGASGRVDASTDAAISAIDARRPDARRPREDDAEANQGPPPQPDAGAVVVKDDPDALLDRLSNLSFELDPGSEPGDVAILNLPPTRTSIDPWYSCSIVGTSTSMSTPLSIVRAENQVTLTGSSNATLMPSDGTTFIGMQYFIGIIPFSLGQMLSEPLPAGTRVRFAIDVSSNDASAQLSLDVLGGQAQDPCFSLARDRPLATAAVTSSSWQTVCVEFTTANDITYFGLSVESTSVVDGHRLFFDNMRVTDECPGD